MFVQFFFGYSISLDQDDLRSNSRNSDKKIFQKDWFYKVMILVICTTGNRAVIFPDRNCIKTSRNKFLDSIGMYFQSCCHTSSHAITFINH